MPEQYEMVDMSIQRFADKLIENLRSGKVVDYDSLEEEVKRLQCSANTDPIELKAYTPKKNFWSNLLRRILNRWPKTAFISAVTFKHFGVLRYFLMLIPRSQVENILQIRQSHNGYTIFHYFVRQDSVEELKQFLDDIKDKDVRYRLLQIADNDGYTALHLATKRRKFRNLQVMLKSVTEEHRAALLLNHANKTESTVLHSIIRFEGATFINKILSIVNKRLLYPLLTKRNSKNKTAAMMAMELHGKDFGLREFLSQSVTARRGILEVVQENEENLEEENERLQEVVGRLQNENGMLQEQNRILQEQNGMLQEQYGKLQEQNGDFRRELASFKEEMGNEMESLKKSNDDFREKNERLEREKDDSEETNRQRFDDQQRQIDELMRIMSLPRQETIAQEAVDRGSTTDGSNDSDN